MIVFLSLMRTLRDDAIPRPLRIAWRALRRSPSYAATVSLSLGLGIALCAAAFSVVNGVLLRPMPYPDPGRLFQVWAVMEEGEVDRMTTSPAMWKAWEEGRGEVAELGAHNVWRPTLSSSRGAEQLTGERVTPGLLDLLGVTPVLGAGFLPDHEVPGNHRVVLLGHSFWQRQFGGGRDVLGSTLILDDQPHVVIGVLPSDFHHPDPHRPRDAVDLFAPLALAQDGPGRDVPALRVLARLGTGTSPSLLRSRLEEALRATGTDRTSAGRVSEIRLISLREEFFSSLRKPALLLLAGTGLVLLIILTNVAHLVLIRAHTRTGDLAIRRALGAGTLDEVRPILWEGIVLTGTAALIGVFVVLAGGGLLHSHVSPYLPTMADVRPDASVVGFTAALAILVIPVLVLAPALSFRRFNIRSVLASGADPLLPAVGFRRTLRKGLGIAEVALAVSLLIGTALLTRTYLHLNAVDPGFGGDALAMEVLAPRDRYPGDEEVTRFYRELEERLSSLPGVVAVGRTSDLPLLGQGRSWDMAPPGAEEAASYLVDYEIVGPGFFEAAGIAMAAGRGFSEVDATGPQVVVVNERLARRLEQPGGVIGTTLGLPGGPAGEMATVIGIAGDVLDDDLGSPAASRAYFLHGQWQERRFAMIVRTAGPPSSLAEPVRRVVAGLDPGVPIISMWTLDELVNRSLDSQRLAFVSSWGIGLLAFFLAVMGVYGTVGYLTELRTREMALRSALGADGRNIMRHVLGDALAILIPGAILGVAIDLVATRVLLSMIFGIGPLDPPSFVVAPLVILSAGVVAGLVPALRAARIDPIEALRHV